MGVEEGYERTRTTADSLPFVFCERKEEAEKKEEKGRRPTLFPFPFLLLSALEVSINLYERGSEIHRNFRRRRNL